MKPRLVGAFLRTIWQLFLLGLAPEGCDLNQPIGTETDMSKTEATTDQETVAKQFTNLVWSGVGPDIKILRFATEQKVTHTSTNQVRLVAMPVQPVEDLEGVVIYLLPGNRVLGTLENSRAR